MRMGEVTVNCEAGMEIELETQKKRKKEEEEDGSPEVVRWEKYLPRMVLRILLVEADDSTRQLISALLRKCSYRVAAVPDGLMAWETLKGRPHSIDLVLTEVDLPSISGFSLLSLVMEHDICKNIPVIMMSSNDSIGMVLKCMLKGAVDFLIKPVRRNELRNLWQHVWRRHCLLEGQDAQKLPLIQHKAEATSENDTASNHSSDYVASTLKNKESSEKRTDEQDLSPSKGRTASNLVNQKMEKQDEFIKLDQESFMRENETREKLHTSGPEVLSYSRSTPRLEEDGGDKTMPQDEGREAENGKANANVTSGDQSCNDVVEEHFNGGFDNHSTPTEAQATLNGGTIKSEFAPELESLKGFFPRSNQGSDERHMLNHSTASAFSWYNISKTFPMEAHNSTDLKDGASNSHKVLFNQSSGIAILMSQPSGPISSDTQDNTMAIDNSGQPEISFPWPPLGSIILPSTGFVNICSGYSHVSPPMYYTQREQSSPAMSTSVYAKPDIQDSGQHHLPPDETANSFKNNVEPHDNTRHDASTACQNAISGLCDVLRNNDNNESSGSYGGTCSRSVGNAPLLETNEKRRALSSLNEGTIHDVFRGKDSHRSSLREAALTKFRLKRKDRCYEKKVRYLSRKNLAEQRPRVKGQFVRQVRKDSRVSNADSCP